MEFLSGCEVLDINGSIDAGYQVQTDSQGSLSARLIVLAEGGRGKLAKKLGIAPHNNILVAMEYEHYTDNLDGRLYLDFDYNVSGYAWNFPKSDGLSLGIGGFLKGKARNGGLPGKLANYDSLM